MSKILYHISKDFITDTMVPRVPKSDFEDQSTPRICFATSIQGCLIGANEDTDITNEVFHVYAIKTDDYYTPTTEEVADVNITGEVWIEYPVKPSYLYDIKVSERIGTKEAKIGNKIIAVPIWKYAIISNKNNLTEKYDPPYNAEQIKQNYGIELYKKLANDPVHKWRMETGIELIHKEPTKKEFDRIWQNWNLMTDEQKKLSDKKSIELFGVSNQEHYKKLVGSYLSGEDKSLNEVYPNKKDLNNKYKDFINSIKSPEKLMDWMTKNITYSFPDAEYDDASSFMTKTGEELWRTKKGHCAEQSYFEKDILENLGYKCYLIVCTEEDEDFSYGPEGSGHLFLIYKDNNNYCYFEHAMEYAKGIHRFSSIKDCLSYVTKVWWKCDKEAKKLVFRKMNGPITGINNADLSKECYKLPVIAITDISKNKIRPLNEVYPNKGESKEDFISRFMSATKDEYPDQKQRLAVAYSYWDRRNKKKLKEEFIAVETRPFELEDILYWYNPEDGTCSAIIDYKKKKTRVRAGLLIIKNNKVLLCKNGAHFDLPGGSIEMGETIEEAAKREAQEEVNITAKNIRETGFDYCTTNDELEVWVAENVPEKYQWYNYYTCLCIGDYSSEFKGKVDAIDKDPEMKNSADWYDIDTIVDNPEFLEPWRNALTKFGYYNKTLTESLLKEDTRNTLINKSKNAGLYKDASRGKNRFERKRLSKIANAVKEFNQINMDDFFKKDLLLINIPVIGETDSYKVSIKMDGVLKEIAKNIKLNGNKFEYKVILQALTKMFNTANVYVNCTCDDYKYRFDHWNIVNNVSTNDSAHDPGPGKGIANPKDEDGRGCKHCLLILSNTDWIMKVTSVIHNYINWLDEHEPKLFAKLIFPKLYGMSEEDAVDNGLLPEDTKLETDKDILDKINEWAKNRGKYQPGSNKNPVTNTGGRAKKEAEKPEEETK